MQAKQETRDAYRSAEAIVTRSAAATVRRIVRQFGDPNTGDYKDPYATETSESVTEVAMKPGIPVTLREEMNFS